MQLRFCGILFKVMSQPRCVASLTAFSCWRAGAKLMTLRMKPGECNQIRAMAGAASRKLRMVTNCGCILPWSRGYRGLTVVLWQEDCFCNKWLNSFNSMMWRKGNGDLSPTELNIATQPKIFQSQCMYVLNVYIY